MRFRPAHISVINRRARSSAVTGAAVWNLQAHQREGVPVPAAHLNSEVPERCSRSRVRFAAPNTSAPLLAARRSGQTILRWAAPAGTLRRFYDQIEKEGLTGRSISVRRVTQRPA